MILFEYKGVQVEGESRDKVELITAELKKQIDLRIYNERAKEILFTYIPESDYAVNKEILLELEEMEREQTLNK
jgi:hypothetical protein|tara:strand:+ start:505 stop:726 length:222 start_codon:yes stop_codon:yes gene_type:complete